MPERIQRQRTKHWRLPEGAVYVGRPTKWGNPFVVGKYAPFVRRQQVKDNAHAVALFRETFHFPVSVGPAIRHLRGKNLACWCPLDQPCHADVLLEWANRGTPGGDE